MLYMYVCKIPKECISNESRGVKRNRNNDAIAGWADGMNLYAGLVNENFSTTIEGTKMPCTMVPSVCSKLRPANHDHDHDRNGEWRANQYCEYDVICVMCQPICDYVHVNYEGSSMAYGMCFNECKNRKMFQGSIFLSGSTAPIDGAKGPNSQCSMLSFHTSTVVELQNRPPGNWQTSN
jgi:hypothetical protein